MVTGAWQPVCRRAQGHCSRAGVRHRGERAGTGHKLSATGKVFWADSYEYDGGNYAKYWQGCDPNSEEARIEGLFQGEYQILETIEKKG